MSELITAANIDLVIEKNNEIRNEVLEQTMKLQVNPAIMKVASGPQLALLILQGFGLIQMPIEDKYWSGAIFVKAGKEYPSLIQHCRVQINILQHGMKSIILFLIKCHLIILLKEIIRWRKERLNALQQVCCWRVLTDIL